MKRFLLILAAIFLIGGLMYFSQGHNLKDNSTSPKKLSADTRIYKSDDNGDFKRYNEKNYQDGYYLLKKKVISKNKSNEFDLCLIFDIENKKIVRLKDVSIETEGEGFQGTVYVEIVSNGKSVIYDILGDISEGPLERPNLDIEDTGRMINASFSSLSESKFLDHIDESGSIFLP
ncbi:hypothetical protein [uncultured Peptoniphilus sp.]|uniref:hypothetical protein n=1 Tax=uncultured Peptoniphilus sp. TaxID=254354 RepID=UPI002600191C|nr:hypothetical protein [uncultured Peptoniphilus sp.]